MAKKFDFFNFSDGHPSVSVPEVEPELVPVLIRCHKVCHFQPCIMHHHVIITYVKSCWTFDFIRSLYNSPRYIVDSVEYISSFQVDSDKS